MRAEDMALALFWAWVAYMIVLMIRGKRRQRMLNAAPNLYSEHVDSRFWKRYFLTLFVYMPLLWVVALFLGFWERSPLPDEIKGMLGMLVVVGTPSFFILALVVAWVWNSWVSTAKPMTRAEAPTRIVDPITGKVTIRRLSRKQRRKEREFAFKQFDRERRGLPPLYYGEEEGAKPIQATGK